MNLALTQSIIIKDLKKIGTKELREKGDWYFKGVVSFLGLSAPQLDAYFKEQYRTTLSSLSPEEAIQLALLLLATPYFESKKVGILLLNKNILDT